MSHAPLLLLNMVLVRTPPGVSAVAPEYYRLLHFLAPTDIVWFRMHSARAVPVWTSRTQVLEVIASGEMSIAPEYQTHTDCRAEGDLTPAERKIRDERYALIEALVTDSARPDLDPKRRGGELERIAREHRTTRAHLYVCLRAYWSNGQTPDALLPGFRACGGYGKERVDSAARTSKGATKRGTPNALMAEDPTLAGINITLEDVRKLQRGWVEYVLNQGMSLRAAYVATSARYYAVGQTTMYGRTTPRLMDAHRRPTFAQFRYWGGKMRDEEQYLKKRKGARNFDKDHRVALGTRDLTLKGPGSEYQIDATILDVHLLSRVIKSRVVGRPVLYLVRDLWSRMIVGYYLGFEGPSWVGAMLALRHAFMSKVEHCRRYGYEITDVDWPCIGLCADILADRGELLSGEAEGMIEYIRVAQSTTPPFRPDWKAIAECGFKLVNDHGIRWLPGAVHHPRKRGERDPRLDASLTLYDLHKIIISIILTHNRCGRLEGHIPDKQALLEGVRPYPIALWEWGLKNRNLLRYEDPQRIRIALLPRKLASVNGKGIHLLGLDYTSQMGIDERWFIRGSKLQHPRVWVSYNPQDVNECWVHSPDGRSISRAELVPQWHVFRGISLDEYRDYRVLLRRDRLLSASADHQARAAEWAVTRAAVKEARARIAAALTDAGDRITVQGAREARRHEREFERQREVGDEACSPTSGEVSPPESRPLPSSNPSYVDLLESLQDDAFRTADS